MPALSVFIDAHNVSLLVYISSTEYYLYNYPYVYSPGLFGSSYDAASFYKAVFEAHLLQHKLQLSNVDLVICSHSAEASLGFGEKLYKPLIQVLKTVHSFYPIVANNYSITTKDASFSRNFLYEKNVKSEVTEVAEEDYYANMNVFPQIIPADIAIQIDIDRNITALLRQRKTKLTSKQPFVFCGSRFSQNTITKELDYLLILDLIDSVGVFDIRVDSFNSLILFSLLKMYSSELNEFPDINREGTLISSKYSVECMVHTDVGTSQLVQLEKDRVMILPLAHDERVNLMIKSHDIDNSEKTVNGGKLGLIFDTRLSKNEKLADIKVFNSGMRTFSAAIGN